MPEPASPFRRPPPLSTRPARQAVIDALREQPRRSALGFTGQATLAAFRLLALCSRAGRDPIVELARHFGCLETTRAFLAFADRAGHCWPDRVLVLRPCCIGISPDEQTLVGMAELALAGDREGFGALLHGFIRADRHDGLFAHAAHMAAALHQSAGARGL